MAKVKVTSKCAIYDGMIMTFKSPCDCTVVDGINVYFQNEKQTFFFRDAHGNDVSEIDDLFKIDTYVTVSLDTTNGYAYLQNADTNAYLEEALAGKASETHGHNLTDSGITGTLPVSKGGTGATDAVTARTNLGAAAASHNHAASAITSGYLSLERGGTNSSSDLTNAPNNSVITKLNDGTYNQLYYKATASGAFFATAANGAPKFGTLPLAQGGTGATSASAARTKLEVAPAKPHSSYVNNYYRTVDSTTEWINPPMVYGTEYRTHERWNGKIIYTKLLDCGSMTNSGTINYSTETVKPVRFAGYTSGGIALPIFLENPVNSTWKCWIDVKNSEIMLHCGSSYGTVHLYVQIWYTKG